MHTYVPRYPGQTFSLSLQAAALYVEILSAFDVHEDVIREADPAFKRMLGNSPNRLAHSACLHLLGHPLASEIIGSAVGYLNLKCIRSPLEDDVLDAIVAGYYEWDCEPFEKLTLAETRII